MILGYVVLDKNGNSVLSEILPLSTSQMRWLDWTAEELSVRINQIMQLVDNFFATSFEVMQTNNIILRRYSRQDDHFHDLIAITDDKEDVMTHLALRKMVSLFQSVNEEERTSELRRRFNEIAFSVMVDTTRGLWNATSFIEIAELIHNMFSMLGHESRGYFENTLNELVTDERLATMVNVSTELNVQSKGRGTDFIEWLKEWNWKPFSAWRLSDLTELLPNTWERSLVINAQLFLRSTDANVPLMSISDLRTAINSLEPSIFKKLLDAKLRRFESTGTYMLLNETIPEISEELQHLASLPDADPIKASLFFILADVTKRPIQEMLKRYFERCGFVHWQAHCDEILFLIYNLRHHEQATVAEMKEELELLTIELEQAYERMEKGIAVKNSDIIHRQVHLIIFFTHGLLNHPDLDQETGIELLRSLGSVWKPLVMTFETGDAMISNRLRGVYSYFMYASLQPLLIELGLLTESQDLYCRNHLKKVVKLLQDLINRINSRRIERDIAQIVLSCFLSSMATLSFYLKEPIVDVMKIISRYTDETFFDQFEGSAFYHWALFYSETNLALQYSALLLPHGSTKLNVLGKLRDNLEYFMFNTPFKEFSVLFWPTLYRHLLSCLKSITESPNDVKRLQKLKETIINESSPFWRATLLKLLEKHDIE